MADAEKHESIPNDDLIRYIKAAVQGRGETDDVASNSEEEATLCGKYVLKRSLGQQYQSVYEARHVDFPHKVLVVKLLRPGSEELQQHFDRERMVLGKLEGLRSPHILTPYDSGNDRGLRFIVTEFVEGETLRQRLDRKRRLTRHEAIRIALQAAAGLAAAHKVGVIHRDIKPSNLMITHDEVVKIIDWGIAREYDPDIGLNGAGSGTEWFISPEERSRNRVTEKTDVYGLGVTFATMLVDDEVADPATWFQRCSRDVPDQLKHFISSMMARDPNDRPTAQAVHDALKLITRRDGQDMPAKQNRRNIVAVVFCVCVFIPLIAFLGWRSIERPKSAPKPPQITETAGKRLSTTTTTVPMVHLPIGHEEADRISEGATPAVDLASSRLFYSVNHERLMMRDLETDQEIQLTDGKDPVLLRQANGLALLYVKGPWGTVANHKIWKYDFATSTSSAEPLCDGNWATASRDGKRLYYRDSGPGYLMVKDIHSGSSSILLKRAMEAYPAVSPDGSYVVDRVKRGDSITIEVIRLATQEIVWSFPWFNQGSVFGWHPHCKHFTIGSFGYKDGTGLWLCDLERKKFLKLVHRTLAGDACATAWSLDGSQFFFDWREQFDVDGKTIGRSWIYRVDGSDLLSDKHDWISQSPGR